MGAGATVLSSILGGGDKETTSHVDYKRMVRDAEAAGFNPLTALRNGGAAGFTSTTTPGSGLSGALSAMGDFLTNFDPMADRRREKEFALLDAQVRNLDAETGWRNTLATASGPVKARPGTASLSSAGTAAQPITPGKLTGTNALQGIGGTIDMSMPDADAGETRYSDAGGWLFGAINAEQDVRKTLGIPGESVIGREAWNTAKTLARVSEMGDDVANYFRNHFIPSGPAVRGPALARPYGSAAKRGVQLYPSSPFFPVFQ